MRQQQQQQHLHYSQPYTSTPVKPSVSPKPGSLIDQERKFNNASPASYSTISNESSIIYQQPHQVITPPPPPPPARSYSTFAATANRANFPDPQEDLYARPREPNQYYTASSAGSQSTATTSSSTKKQFMKPSEFYADKVLPQPPPAVKGGVSVLPTGNNSFGKPFKMAQPLQQQHHIQRTSGDDRQSEDYQEEYSHYDSGPISSEEVYETATSDGGVSLKRIFTKQQTSTTKNVVSSTRKVVTKREGSN